MFIWETVGKTQFVISENDVELLAIVWPWATVELAKHYIILLPETVKFWGIDLLIDLKIKIESESEDLEIESCS